MPRKGLLRQLFVSYVSVIVVCVVASSWFASKSLEEAGVAGGRRAAGNRRPHGGRSGPQRVRRIGKSRPVGGPRRPRDGRAADADPPRRPAAFRHAARRRPDGESCRPPGNCRAPSRRGDAARPLQQHARRADALCRAAGAAERSGGRRGAARGRSMAAIDGQFGPSRDEIIGAACGVALLGGVLSWFLARRIARPVRELSDGAERIAHGRLQEKLTDARHRRIGRPGRSAQSIGRSVGGARRMRSAARVTSRKPCSPAWPKGCWPSIPTSA